MDNPWNSPWTTVDDDGANDVREPPPQSSIVFPSSAAFELADAIPSPWAVADDSFGNWAEPERHVQDNIGKNSADPLTGEVGSGFGPSPLVADPQAASSDTVNESLERHLTKGDYGGFGLSDNGWAFPSQPETLPSPSPDPWAINDMLNDGQAGATTTALSPKPVFESNFTEAQKSPPQTLATPSPPEPTSPTDNEAGSDNSLARSASPELRNAASTEDLVVGKARNGPVPTTSDGTRQVSKVQELVDMYDGIAKTARKPRRLSPTGDARKMQLKEPADSAVPLESQRGDDDEVEAGNGGAEAAEATMPRPLTPPKSPKSAEAQSEQAASSPAPNPQHVPDSPVSTSSSISSVVDPTTLLSPMAPRPKTGPVSFEVDLTLVGRLFDGLADVIIPQPADVYDRFEDDFPTSSARKAWYLVSRAGSLRMHNSGDQDSYTRAGWHGSAISTETYQIVRRWMDEGPITGRHVGGASVGKTAAMFGWDQSSSSDPVDLSILNRRRHNDPTTPMKARAPAPVSESPSQASIGSLDKMSSPRQVGGRDRPVPTQEDSTTKVATEAPSATMEPESESDEEWGDMISSPAKGTAFEWEASRSEGPSRPSQPTQEPLTPVQPVSIEPSKPQAGKSTVQHSSISPRHKITTAEETLELVSSIGTDGKLATTESELSPQEARAVKRILSSLPDLSYMLQ